VADSILKRLYRRTGIFVPFVPKRPPIQSLLGKTERNEKKMKARR